MPRQYTVIFENVTISAAQDLFELKGAAGKIIKLKRFKYGATNTTLPTAQMMRTEVTFLPATVTDGSGGTTPTPQKTDPGDAAASFTALANNTTPASTSGTAANIYASGDHIYAGVDHTFPDPPSIGPSEAIVIKLLSAVTGTCAFSGTAFVEEHGG